MATAQHWRFLFTSNNGGTYVKINEIQMRMSKFGQNLCVGGTAVASGVYSTQTASQAFDGSVYSDANAWMVEFTPNCWIQYTFAESVEVNYYTIMASNQDAPSSWILQYSIDGISWINAHKPPELEVQWHNRERRIFSITFFNKRLPYSSTQLITPYGGGQNLTNDGNRVSPYTTWYLSGGARRDVLRLDFNEPQKVGFVRSYYRNLSGGGENQHIVIGGNTYTFDKENPTLAWADTSGTQAAWVWYIDVEINQITDSMIFSTNDSAFNFWFDISEILVYEQATSTPWRISGHTLRAPGHPAQCTVNVHDQMTGRLVRTLNSDPVTGYYEHITTDVGPFFVRASDPQSIYKTEIVENIVPNENNTV